MPFGKWDVRTRPYYPLKLNFDILHDEKNALAAQFGLKFFYPKDLKELYRDKFNINLEVQQGNDEWALPMPARFVIDQQGIIHIQQDCFNHRRPYFQVPA